MKKKLLTILLSVFMMITTFTTNVFAEDFSTVSQILDTFDGGFPLADGTIPGNAWVKSGNINMKCYKDQYSLHIGDDTVDFGSVTKVDDNSYTSGTNAYCTVTFNLEGGKLISITHAGGSYMDSTHGTYRPITIADILPNDFPDNESNAWKNDNGLKAYISSNELKVGYKTLSLNEKATKVNDQKYSSSNDIDFNLDQTGKLISIVLSISMDGDNGTYVAPTTIADILGTVSGGFPTTSSSGWVSQSGVKMYIDGNNLQSGTGNIMALNAALTPVGDNYSISPSLGFIFTFVMESGVLSRIDLQPLGQTVSYCPYAYTNLSISKPVGYTGDIEFVTNGKYVDQTTTEVKVSVDNNPLTYNTDYEVSTGSTPVCSTYVKLKGSFVSTLHVGTHTLKTSMDGYDDITTQFTITAAPTPTPDPEPDPTPESKPVYVAPKTGVE